MFKQLFGHTGNTGVAIFPPRLYTCGHLAGPAYRIAGRHAGAHVSDRRWRLGDRRDHEGA